jgi:hypothetical protein
MRKGTIEKKKTKVKKAEKIDGSFKIGSKSLIWSSYFSNHKLSIT